MEDRKLNILLLCDYQPYHAATMVDHVNALYYYSRHNVFVLPLLQFRGEIPGQLDLERFDCVIVHYSLTLVIDAYISPRSKDRLARFGGLKAIFIQDEYRFVDRTVQALRDIGFQLLFTCVPEAEFEKVYPASKLPQLQRINVLTGYVPFWLTILPTRPLRERPIHIGYRGRRYPQWHGRLGEEKWKIAKQVKADARRHRLRTDISVREKDRLYGARWPEFLMRCKSVLGVESGASIFDFANQIGPRTETYAGLLRVRDKDRVTVEEARELFFGNREDQINLRQISPRCFEVVAVRSLLVLYEGEYSGVLKPWVHYLPLRKDHSNFSEVAETLRDDKTIAKIVSQAFADVACSDAYSYKTFVARFDAVLADAAKTLGIDERKGYEGDEFEQRYPFYYVQNPHLATNYKLNMLAKAGGMVRRVIPSRVKEVLRVMLRYH